jgi:Glycosyl hydrolase family 76
MSVTSLARNLRRAALAALCCWVASTLAPAPAAAGAARNRSAYPAGATRPAFTARPSRGRAGAGASAAAARRKKTKKPTLKGDPARGLLAFQAMQRAYYIPGSGLYKGEPFSYLWPFSQAFAATVSLANVPALQSLMSKELQARLVGLRNYYDPNNSGAPEGFYTSALPAYDGTVAPPAGPGGAKYYDDNDWVGIELVRLYEQKRQSALLAAAEGIMAFEMAGWQASPTLGCPGGIPFSNLAENTDRNTITAGPAAELALQLYRVTANAAYLQFAIQSYEWARSCLLQPTGLYADHLNRRGLVEPALYSYTQGVMIGAGAMLYQETGNGAYLYEARQTAAAALTYFTPERLGVENPFFPSIYFRNILYLDSITHDPPGPKLAQAYVDYAWTHLRLSNDLFVAGSPPTGQLLVQAAIVQIYALLSSKPSTYF